MDPSTAELMREMEGCEDLLMVLHVSVLLRGYSARGRTNPLSLSLSHAAQYLVPQYSVPRTQDKRDAIQQGRGLIKMRPFSYRLQHV